MACGLSDQRGVHQVEVLVRALIQVDRVGSIGQYLSLLEVLVGEQNFIDLE